MSEPASSKSHAMAWTFTALAVFGVYVVSLGLVTGLYRAGILTGDAPDWWLFISTPLDWGLAQGPPISFVVMDYLDFWEALVESM